jgi:hypothetical protein
VRQSDSHFPQVLVDPNWIDLSGPTLVHWRVTSLVDDQVFPASMSRQGCIGRPQPRLKRSFKQARSSGGQWPILLKNSVREVACAMLRKATSQIEPESTIATLPRFW